LSRSVTYCCFRAFYRETLFAFPSHEGTFETNDLTDNGVVTRYFSKPIEPETHQTGY
jgi:hypothetical protein